MDVTLHLAQDPEADALLGRSPLAALVGMLLDQQVPMEWAFKGPRTIADRLGADAAGATGGAGDLDAHDIAALDPEAFAALLSEKPAVHRYPGSMAKRIQQLCQYLVEHYDGDAEAVWRGVPGGAELLKRLEDLPGFGKQKAQIFLALLGKQLGVTPQGWREAAGAYGEPESFRSVADITGPESLAKVRAHKQEMKAAAKAKASGKSGR
ncbi:HhH-GPD-type base excision DNA repair protein [Streptomyces sp. NPDC052101]|uniref:HhH-GPD-type base excision DNA repair protein n=1 Tax=Streptomyces sp. NPDC052101 TaxID=3155763 RepID=UPI00343BC399